MPATESLPYIADTLIPRYTAEAQRLSAAAEARAQSIEQLILGLKNGNDKDDAAFGQVYEVVDRLRVAAKDAQNVVDRAFTMSHATVPQVEGAFPCSEANKAVNMAHALHLSIGRSKGAIGNPPGGAEKSTQGFGATDEEDSLGSGACDILAGMERRLGRLSKSKPGQLFEAMPPDSKEQAMLPLADAAQRCTAVAVLALAQQRERRASFIGCRSLRPRNACRVSIVAGRRESPAELARFL
eukprot:gnl/TRDRNA2_/TRDRNA2_196123_c0_seq1.p1 gnl/TRDRNA2_/TRDRNA2_196123_c0~~gnl/TRDRNA2_/TRDRNA2_196123_c0_seq1.p1  ORF type:complete len:241 (-),score=39.03 gnl/TRDRNA2_/TRDRNA2_196123_c0_seq1:33-755(-)